MKNLLQEEEEGGLHTDPFGELIDGNDVFVKIESNFPEEEHFNEEDVSYDFVAEENVDQKIPFDDMSEYVSAKWKTILVLLSIHFIRISTGKIWSHNFRYY